MEAELRKAAMDIALEGATTPLNYERVKRFLNHELHEAGAWMTLQHESAFEHPLWGHRWARAGSVTFREEAAPNCLRIALSNEVGHNGFVTMCVPGKSSDGAVWSLAVEDWIQLLGPEGVEPLIQFFRYCGVHNPEEVRRPAIML